MLKETHQKFFIDGIRVNRSMTERQLMIGGNLVANQDMVFPYRNFGEDPGGISVMFPKHIVGDDQPVKYLGSVNSIDLLEEELKEIHRDDMPRIRAEVSAKKSEEHMDEALDILKQVQESKKSATISGKTLSGILDSGEVAARVMRSKFL